MSNDPGKPAEDPQIAEAWTLAEAGKLDEADRRFELACGGEHAGPAYNGRGAIAAKRGDFARAAELFEQACRLSPKEPLFHYQLGVAMLSTGRPDAAIRAFEACVGLDPDFGHAWFNLGAARNHVRRPDEAIEAFKRAAAAARPVDQAEASIVSTLRSQGRIDDAIVAAREAISKRDDSAPAWNELGLCLAAKGDLDTAMACWDRVLEIEPSFHEARFQRGVGTAMRGRLEEAERIYRDLIAREPRHVRARVNLSGILMHRGDHAGAERELSAAAPHAGPLAATVVVAMADLRIRQDRLGEAERAYREAIRIAPGDLRAQAGLLGAMLGQERPTEALAEIERFESATPNQPLWNDCRAEAFIQLDRHGEAREILERALASHGPTAVRHAMLGRVHEALGDSASALAAYDRALGIDPNFAPASEGRARVGG
jgi:tetratricopeptide (TPR) repeat protein